MEPLNIDDLFGFLVGVEVFALATSRIPPITRLTRKHRVLALPVVAVIAMHLVRKVADSPIV